MKRPSYKRAHEADPLNAALAAICVGSAIVAPAIRVIAGLPHPAWALVSAAFSLAVGLRIFTR